MNSKGYVTKMVKLGVYPVGVKIYIASDMEKAYSDMCRNFWTNGDTPPPPPGEREGSCRMEGGRIALLVHRDANTEVVVHECTHAVSFALSWVGVDYGDHGNNEVLAYPLGFLAREVFNFMHPHRTPATKKKVK